MKYLMKSLRYVIALLLAFCVLGAEAGNIVPTPKRIEKRGEAFTILTTTKITHSDALRPLAQYLTKFLPLTTQPANASERGVIALRENKNLAPEEYRLQIDAQGVLAEGGSYAGVHCAVETLLQLLPSEVYGGRIAMPVVVGGCVVEDEPRFAYRGFMLDVSRTWVDKAELEVFIENLAHHKINKLHLHLSDDESWRIEIKSHPELAEVGAFRGKGSPIAARYGEWGKRYGGYYTQAEMRQIVEFAAVRGVEIIPEIDLPGHSHALARVHPEVLCSYQPTLTSSGGYDTRNVLCVAKESNYTLLDDVMRELAEIFPSSHIHIGGDEVSTSQWIKCPDCKALMERENMTKAEELQAYFMNRVAKIIEKYGKRPSVWNEAINTGQMTRSAQVYGWESVEKCLKSTAEGYSTVVMPGAYFYFDMRQTPREHGHDWAAVFDARKTLSFDFAEQGFSAEQMKNVAGVQGSFWSEAYLSHRDAEYNYLEYQTYPRICALSELAWRGEGGEWSAFYRTHTESHYSRMASMGIDFRLFPPVVEYADGVLTARSDDRNKIYYKVLGSDEEHLYQGPIKTDKPARYGFYTRLKGAVSPEAGVKARYRMLQPKVTITSSITPSERFPLTNAEGYGRISRTSRVGKEGDWILYTFEEPVTCRRMEISTGNLQLPRFIFNAGFVEVSYDGKNFERVCDLKCGAGSIDNPSKPIKAVRVTCTEAGNCDNFVTIQAPKVYPKL